MSELKLSLLQANLAFDVLDLLQQHFPENPELTVDVLKVILQGITETLEADNGKD